MADRESPNTTTLCDRNSDPIDLDEIKGIRI
jgi:hypothetical protein